MNSQKECYGLSLDTACKIEREIKVQISFENYQPTIGHLKNQIARESELMFLESLSNPNSAIVHAVRIAAYAVRAAQILKVKEKAAWEAKV